MPFRIATDPGRPDHPNEDFAAVSADCAVLLDGVTARPDNGCRHGVAWFTRSLGGLLLAGADAGPPLDEALAEAIAGVSSLHAATCDLANPRTPSATVVAVRVRDGVLEYLVLSDSVLVAEQPEGVRVVADTRLDDLEERLAVGSRDAGAGRTTRGVAPDRGGAALTVGPNPGVEAYRNVPGGFWTAGADPAAADEALTGTLLPGTFAALTDGASRAVEVFGACRWDEALTLVTKDGPDALVSLVRELERADPEGTRHPRGKGHDDATVVAWSP
ncbi:protein phosphatase 2C domain-containing protein [Nocardiopsis sp. NPDC049922]|uniref:protein phosphatase 2C domain-containing protein n=1 Tax=Nocardiopsis sp. NPDC049922 TaxID=3155157 RepID=UPI0033E69676